MSDTRSVTFKKCGHTADLPVSDVWDEEAANVVPGPKTCPVCRKPSREWSARRTEQAR